MIEAHLCPEAVGAGAPAQPNPSTEEQSRDARSLAEFIGQTEAVRRLTTLLALARRRGEVLGHILLLGPAGFGKRTLAHIIAREMGVNLRSTTGSTIERGGDLAAIINDLDKGDVLLIQNIGRLRAELVELLASASRTFELDIVVGKGPGARAMRLALKPFMLVATSRSENDCSRELLDSFDIVIRLQPYKEAGILQLTERFAVHAGLTIDPAALALVARLADGNPAHIEPLLRRLRFAEEQPVSEQAAREILSIFGYGNQPAITGNALPTNWTGLSGVEFEKLIAALLKSMGFVAELTKTTGDGGIDIEATLDRPIVGGRYLFQCKRFAPDALVGCPTIREFFGAVIADRKAVKGVFVTTSAFTSQAREFAANLPIELIDGVRLAQLMTEHMETEASPKSLAQSSG